MLQNLTLLHPKHRNPWTWIPLLYMAKGLPYVTLMTLSLFVFKRMGMENGDIVLYTSLFLFPWVIKPLWRPLIDLYRTRRFWIFCTETVIVLALAGVAWSVSKPDSMNTTMLCFWLLAFGSASHDTAVDSFYQLGVLPSKRMKMVPVRRFFYRLTMVLVQGVVVMMAGNLEVLTRNVRYSWSTVIYLIAAVFLCLFVANMLLLPHPADRIVRRSEMSVNRLKRVFKANINTFVRKPHARVAIAFLLVYLLAEGMMAKVALLFLIDRSSIGGLGLSPQEFGFVQGTVGVFALVSGGMIGNRLVHRIGLKRCLWPMAAALTLPKLAFVYLAFSMPEGLSAISSCLFLEQFGLGFGMTAYIMFLVYFSQGERVAAHYGIGIALMSLSLMLSGVFSGICAELFGYRTFFIVVLLMGLLTFFVTFLVKVPPSFGMEITKKRAFPDIKE